MKSPDSNILALCDKAIQIPQVIGMIKCNKSMSMTNFGENIIVVVVDTMGNNSDSYKYIKEELDRHQLCKTKIVQYDYYSQIYKGDFSTEVGINNIIDYIKYKLNRDITQIVCALLSQRFVKVHLDAYSDASVYMIEDGLASYLNVPVKYVNNLPDHYKIQGVVLSHMKRVKKINLLHSEIGIPKSQLNFRYLNVDLNKNLVEETKKRENIYTFFNERCLKINRDLLFDFWKHKAINLELSDGIEALLIGQNFSDFCDEFYFRDEIDLYIETCELLLSRFKTVLFVPHPKLSTRVINIMKTSISEPSRLVIHENPNIPVESIVLVGNAPKYVFGFYSTAMWNIRNHLGIDHVYTVLGWSTINLYNKLGHDIQKQAYRKARQMFFPIEKVLSCETVS